MVSPRPSSSVSEAKQPLILLAPFPRPPTTEPDAIVAIKLRKDKIAAMMNRLDSKYPELKKATEDASLSAEDRTKAGEELAKREKLLAPTYAGIANLYADLHDRVGRMEAKGCAKRAVWRESRRFFYWRLRRRIDEEVRT